MPRRPRPSAIREWAVPFDPPAELDWGRPDYSRRLLREHLDQAHDGASRRLRVVDTQVSRLARLLPRPPARILDAGCGPGLYATRLARRGYEVVGVDVSPAAVAHARRAAASQPLGRRVSFVEQDLRNLASGTQFDAAILVYFVLEAFPRMEQPRVLRRIAGALAPGGPLVVEMRIRPDQPPGRTAWWDVVDESVLADRRHLLIGDAQYDPRRHTYVLREIAVFDDGTIATQQTSGWLCPFDAIPRLFARGGLGVRRIYDGWSSQRATGLSETVLVVATPEERRRARPGTRLSSAAGARIPR